MNGSRNTRSKVKGLLCGHLTHVAAYTCNLAYNMALNVYITRNYGVSLHATLLSLKIEAVKESWGQFKSNNASKNAHVRAENKTLTFISTFCCEGSPIVCHQRNMAVFILVHPPEEIILDFRGENL